MNFNHGAAAAAAVTDRPEEQFLLRLLLFPTGAATELPQLLLAVVRPTWVRYE